MVNKSHSRAQSGASIGDACNVNDEEEENGPYEDKQAFVLSDIENEMLDSRLLMVNTRNAIPRRLTNDTAGSVIMWQH